MSDRAWLILGVLAGAYLVLGASALAWWAANVPG